MRSINMQNYIPYKLQGIPCLIEVLKYEKHLPDHSADSDLDYCGYYETDYNIRDRKGYRATWLEAKIRSADDVKIVDLINAKYNEEF